MSKSWMFYFLFYTLNGRYCLPSRNNNSFCDNTCDACDKICIGTSCQNDNFYSAALTTIIRCSEYNSCSNGKFYIGESNGPSNYDARLFTRASYSSANIFCQDSTSCKNMNIEIIGNFVNGVVIHADKGLENANIAVNISEGQIVNIYCNGIGCNSTKVRCLGGICKCNDIENNENDGCVDFIVDSPNPTIRPTVVPTISPSDSSTFTPTIDPTFNPTLSLSESPSTTPLISPTNLTAPKDSKSSSNYVVFVFGIIAAVVVIVLIILLIISIVLCQIKHRNIKSDIMSSATNSNSIITTSIHDIKSIPLPVSIKSMDNESLAMDMESMYDNKSVTSTTTDKMMNGEYNENSSDDGIEMIADPKTPNNEQINLF